jgi:hypothetical protein
VFWKGPVFGGRDARGREATLVTDIARGMPLEAAATQFLPPSMAPSLLLVPLRLKLWALFDPPLWPGPTELLDELAEASMVFLLLLVLPA